MRAQVLVVLGLLLLASISAIVIVLAARRSASGTSEPETVALPSASSSSDPASGSASFIERAEALDNDENFLLVWRADFVRKHITFELTAKTLGFVGFGLSRDGGMTAADIVVGGVHEDGSSYFSDRHGTGNWEPVLDRSQDWTLRQAHENGTHTVLVIDRPFSTCDDEDVEIDNSTVNLIWAFGASDDLQYHGSTPRNRGAYMVNLLDPPVAPPSSFPGVKKWRVTSDTIMPAVPTFYGCTIHRAPPLDAKHHIVGYETYLSSPAAQEHVHHWMVRQCVPTASVPLLAPHLEKWVGEEPFDCFKFERENTLCPANPITWGIRGKPIVFPDEAGLAFGGGNASEPTYYMLEVHYNNPDLLQGVRFEAGVDVFYTTQLRKYDVGSLIVGYTVDVTQIIPPHAASFTSSGHCDPGCLQRYVPPGDVGGRVFNILLHSHLAARKMKVRHFRGDVELPWLDNNEHYQFNYQQSRPFREPVSIRAGDRITLECTYETMDRVNATFGGISTSHEMCEAYLLYYPVGETSGYCGSNVPKQIVLDTFGVEAVEGDMHDPVVTQPVRFAGQRFIDFVNNNTVWMEESSAAWERTARYAEHELHCFPELAAGQVARERRLGYPTGLRSVYKPKSDCQKGE